MKLEFKTRRNQYGHRETLIIDTIDKAFTRKPQRMIPEGIEIKTRDYKDLVKQLEKEGYKEI